MSAAFLRDPGACRVVLLFGDDTGLIRERAEALVRLVAGALDDPFRVAELAREDVGAAARRGGIAVADRRAPRGARARGRRGGAGDRCRRC